MNKKSISLKLSIYLFLILIIVGFYPASISAQGIIDDETTTSLPALGSDEKAADKVAENTDTPVELTGDVIEYSVEGNMITAQGNVVMVHKNATLTCDRVEFSRANQEANAQGNVRL